MIPPSAFKAAGAPTLQPITTTDLAGNGKVTVHFFNGELTLLDAYMIPLLVTLPDCWGRNGDTDEQLDEETAKLWRLAASVARTRPTPPVDDTPRNGRPRLVGGGS